MKWKNRVKSEFLDEYAEISGMPLLSFKPSVSESYKILLLGPEQGGMSFCSKALLYAAKSLKAKKPEKTLVDIMPSLDALSSVLENGMVVHSMLEKYDMVVQVTSCYKEEWPYCNGYFAVPQVLCNSLPDGKKQIIIHPATKDLVGTIVNKVRTAGFALQTLNDDGFVGDRYIMASHGILLPASRHDDDILIGTRNPLALECQKLGVESVILAAPASKLSKNREALDSHKVALEAVIGIYERQKN